MFQELFPDEHINSEYPGQEYISLVTGLTATSDLPPVNPFDVLVVPPPPPAPGDQDPPARRPDARRDSRRDA